MDLIDHGASRYNKIDRDADEAIQSQKVKLELTPKLAAAQQMQKDLRMGFQDTSMPSASKRELSPGPEDFEEMASARRRYDIEDPSITPKRARTDIKQETQAGGPPQLERQKPQAASMSTSPAFDPTTITGTVEEAQAHGSAHQHVYFSVPLTAGAPDEASARQQENSIATNQAQASAAARRPGPDTEI